MCSDCIVMKCAWDTSLCWMLTKICCRDFSIYKRWRERSCRIWKGELTHLLRTPAELQEVMLFSADVHEWAFMLPASWTSCGLSAESRELPQHSLIQALPEAASTLICLFYRRQIKTLQKQGSNLIETQATLDKLWKESLKCSICYFME